MNSQILILRSTFIYPRCYHFHQIKLFSQKRTRVIKPRGEFLFGISPCLAAMRHRRRRIHSIYLREDNEEEDEMANISSNREKILEAVDGAKNRGVPILRVNTDQLEVMSGKRPHQGVVLDVSTLVATKIHYEEIGMMLETMPTEKQLWLFLNEIRDPMNLGAIFRSSLFFGSPKIFLSKKCSKLSPVVSKASSGAMEAATVYSVAETEEFLEDLSKKFEIIGTCSHEDGKIQSSQTQFEDITNFKIGSRHTLLVFGSEGEGLNESIRKYCNRLISIHPHDDTTLPQGLDSLNVSVSAAIMLYSISSQLK